MRRLFRMVGATVLGVVLVVSSGNTWAEEKVGMIEVTDPLKVP